MVSILVAKESLASQLLSEERHYSGTTNTKLSSCHEIGSSNLLECIYVSYSYDLFITCYVFVVVPLAGLTFLSIVSKLRTENRLKHPRY